MARKKSWIASLIAVGILSTVAARFAFADNGSNGELEFNEYDYNWKYYVGSTHPAGREGKFYYFDTLEELRPTTRPNERFVLGDKDILRLFKDDTSLTEQLQLEINAPTHTWETILFGLTDEKISNLTSSDVAEMIEQGSVKFVSSDFKARQTLKLSNPGDQSVVQRFLDIDFNNTYLGPHPTYRNLSFGLNFYSELQFENLIFQGGNEQNYWVPNNSGVFVRVRAATGGGAILFQSGGNATFVNTDFIGNTTESYGGAIRVQNGSANITLKVMKEEGNALTTMTFRDNKDLYYSIDSNDPTIKPTYILKSNSIAFTNSGTTTLLVDTEENTLLDMQDPFTKTGGGNFTVTKQGLGTWRLDGETTIAGASVAQFHIDEGTFELVKEAKVGMTSSRNTFQVASGATLSILGGNGITASGGTGTIQFDENSTLKFDLDFYDDKAKSVPMLELTAETILFGYQEAELENSVYPVSNIRIDIDNVDQTAARNGEYLLIQGSSTLHVDFTKVALYIDGIAVDNDDMQNERFGYNFKYDQAQKIVDDTKLILSISETDNTVLRWNGTANEWNRNTDNENWNLIRPKAVDALISGDTVPFISGDTVQFFKSGTHVIDITTDVVIAHNSVTDKDGKTWYAGTNDTTGMHVSGDGHWTFTGKAIQNNGSYGPSSLLYDGSGSLTLENETANSYAWNVLAGTGTLNVARSDLLGTQAVIFADNDTPKETAKLHFTGATTLTTQLVAAAGGNGLVTVDNGYGVNLTITAPAGKTENLGSAVYVMDGGTLTIKADPTRPASGPSYGRIIFENNVGGESLAIPGRSGSGAVFVAETGELTLENVEFRNNTAWRDGGAIATHGLLTVQNGTFIGNTSPGSSTEPNRGFGGALSTGGSRKGSVTTIIDTTFTGNSAAIGGGAIAAGVETGESLRLTIAATDGGTTLFSGNLDGLGNSNAVYLTGSGRGKIDLVVDTAQNGTVDMRDAIRTGETNFTLNVSKTGDGTWKLAGNNVFQARWGTGTTFTIEQGTLDFYRADTDLDAASITIDTGAFGIDGGGNLISRGGNAVTAKRVEFANGAILSFDLDRLADASYAGPTYPYSDPLLLVTANSYDFDGGRQMIDLVALSTIEDDGIGVFNLAKFVNHKLDIGNMTLLLRGEDISTFRQSHGTLQTDATGSILQVEIHKTQNGTTQWTGAQGNSVWNAVSLNWEGTDIGPDDITGTSQFLHGDAVIFTNIGAGGIEVNAGGVEIADQKDAFGTLLAVGMTVENYATTGPEGEIIGNDYTFYGGSISGNARLLKRGTGKVTFEQENYFANGIVVEAGTVVAKKIDSLKTDGTINLTQDIAVVQFDVNEHGSYDTQITGVGSFVKSGGGSLRLGNSANDYSGGTTILGGELVATHVTSFGTGSLVTGVDEQSGVAVFDLNTEDDRLTFAQRIFGTGGVKNIGTTALVLSGENRYSGETTNEAEATLIGTNVSAFGTGALRNEGKVFFELDRNDGGTFAQDISGTGEIYKAGDGKLTLAGNGTYTGDTILREGELHLNSETAAAASIIRFEGGDLTFGELERITIGGLAGGRLYDQVSLNSPKGQAITLTINQTKIDWEDDETIPPVFDGMIAGDGALIKDGLGTQVFTGENTYTGGTLIRNGRLTSGVDGLGTGDVINDAELEFIVKDDESDSFGNRIVGTGAVYKSGEGILELTGENTYSGGTFITEGHLIAKSLGTIGTGNVVIQGAETTFTLDLAADAQWTREISGAGDFYKAGQGSLFVESTLLLKGTTHIVGGTLYLNGSSLSETIVYDGGTLSGNGVLDNTATFRRGASHRIGHKENMLLSTFTAKELAYEDGSRIYIKVGKNGNDQVVAKESIDFGRGGGNVEVILVNLGFDDFDDSTAPVNRYEIFISEKNRLLLDGTAIANHESDTSLLTVDGVDASISFLSDVDEGLGILGYQVKTNEDSSKSIFLDVVVTDPGAVGFLDWNQRTILAGLGDVDAFNRLYSVSRDQRGQVINYLMPQIQTVMPYLTQRAVTQFNVATYERLRFLRETHNSLAVNDPEARSYRAQFRRPADYVWFQNYGDFLKMARHGNISEFRADSYGFNLGFDRNVAPHSSVGLGMGGYFSEVKANDVQQEGEANSFLLSLYGNWYGNADWLFTGSTGFVFSSYEIDRHASLFDTKLHSRHDGMTVFASLEGSKKFRFDRFEVAPYFGVDVIWLGEDGYTEKASGAYDSLALKVRYQSTWSLLTSLGVRFGRPYRMLGGNVFHPTVYAAWIHDWAESDIATKASFAGMPAFKIRGASMNRDRAQIGANLNMTLSPRTDMFAKFNAELANRYSDVSVHWGFQLGF